jgi:diguanylate cyclase (GGDEF)-like protein/PAS domain S-box-containing protein
MDNSQVNPDIKTLNYIYSIIQEGIWDWNANTGEVKRSPGWYKMLGYEVGELDETVLTWENLIHSEDYPTVMAVFDQYVTGQSDFYQAEYRCKKSDGNYLWIFDKGRIVERNKDGSIARMIGAHTNIHDHKLAEFAQQKQNKMLMEDNFNLENIVQQRTQELEKLNLWLEEQVKKSNDEANTDVLTSLYNRRKFEIELSKEISRSKRYLSSLSILLIDADHFKNINDQYGHKLGDQVLQNMANTISTYTRKPDVAARWGGEEFVVILPETSLSQALQIAEKQRGAIESMPIDAEIRLTCSIGVTEIKPSDDLDSLMLRADRALYDAKKAGRNCVSWLE